MRLPVVQTARSDGPCLVCWCMLNVAESDWAELGPARASLQGSFQRKSSAVDKTVICITFLGSVLTNSSVTPLLRLNGALQTGVNVGFVLARPRKLVHALGLSGLESENCCDRWACHRRPHPVRGLRDRVQS